MYQITNARTLTGKLALFFIGLSVTVGILCCSIFVFTLQWSEDLVAERRLLVDQQVAIKKFSQSSSHYLVLDPLTEAYNDISILPQYIKPYVIDKQPFIDDIDVDDGTVTVSFSYYLDNQTSKPLILITKADNIEISTAELSFFAFAILLLIGMMLMILARLLFKLSTKIISPVNRLSYQLEQAKGDADYQFMVAEKSATEFQQLTNELNRYRNEMQGLIKREQAFARYASHELRTPLTIAKGANKILANTQLDNYQQRQMQRVHQAIMDMEVIVNALLSLVKYEREQGQIKTQQFTAEQLANIIQNHDHQATEKGIKIKVDVEIEPWLKAEYVVMEMLIGNLIRNALAATEQGDIAIILNDQMIQVLDLGRGLTADNNPQGHGLGLLIINDICQRYQWTFSLTNREQRGCIAEIRFSEAVCFINSK